MSRRAFIDRRPIDERKIASLRNLFIGGTRVTVAAAEADVHLRTAAAYFKAFAAAGLKRGLVEPARRPNQYGLPKYYGPDWIG